MLHVGPNQCIVGKIMRGIHPRGNPFRDFDDAVNHGRAKPEWFMPLKPQDRIRLVITTCPCFVIYDNYSSNNPCIVEE